MDFGKKLTVTTTPIPGLVVIQLPVHGDNRGWFKENWQREKMVALGLPDFGPVQNNISFNEKPGTTRGIHAEPWDKYVSVAAGRVFGAWVDLREGDTFGTPFTLEVDPTIAVFVPRGVGNGFQTLEPDTAYTYLVNDHWRPDGAYTFLNLADETVALPWPIDIADVEISEKDANHPRLAAVTPTSPKSTIIIGGNGQLGTALADAFPGALPLSRAEFDIAHAASFDGIDWPSVGTVINASAYTKVDLAETADGRREAWATNVTGVARLARTCTQHGITLVHVSSDYVFDGTQTGEATEDLPFSPLGVYGQTKAAGDALVAQVPRHFIIRTSWVIGDGGNFVRTMFRLANNDVNPDVVNDQFGRLTFTSEISGAIQHLLGTNAPFGTYNVTNTGDVVSWFDIAREVFRLAGHDPERVSPISTEMFTERNAAPDKPISPRPRQSSLSLVKLIASGYEPRDWGQLLRAEINATAVAEKSVIKHD